MPSCKSCSEWFVKTRDDMVLCSKCEIALGRLAGYAVPVVRCKDCVNGDIIVKDSYKYIICCLHGIRMDRDDFCNYGARKEE